MEMRSGLDGLRSLLGISQTSAPATPQVRSGAGTPAGAQADRATLSNASQAALSDGDADVRLEKVAAIQAALAAGTYAVPAPAVASRMVDAMLAGGR